MDTAINIRCFCLDKAASKFSTVTEIIKAAEAFYQFAQNGSRTEEPRDTRYDIEPKSSRDDVSIVQEMEEGFLTGLQAAFMNHVIDIHQNGHRPHVSDVARRMKRRADNIKAMAKVMEGHGYISLWHDGKRKWYIKPLKYPNGKPFIFSPIEEYTENGQVIKRYPSGYAYGYASEQTQEKE